MIRNRKLFGSIRLCGKLIQGRSLLTDTTNKKAVELYYNDEYEVILPPNHRFPMQKYRRVREKLQREYTGNPNVLFSPSPLASREELITTHCPEYVDRYVKGQMTEKEVRRAGHFNENHKYNRN
jgi:acetoin utilization deacetylase AcuC-like enzyme